MHIPSLEKRRSRYSPPGRSNSWDERTVADPYVIRIDPYFYLYYLGHDRAQPPRQRIGVARSTRWHPLGEAALATRSWLRRRPVPSMKPATANQPSGSRTAITGCSSPAAIFPKLRRLGLARSTDGSPLDQRLPAVLAGASAWDSKVICDPYRAGRRRRHPCLVRRRRCRIARRKSARPDRLRGASSG